MLNFSSVAFVGYWFLVLLYFGVDEVFGFVVYTCYWNDADRIIDENPNEQIFNRFDYIYKKINDNNVFNNKALTSIYLTNK